MINAVEYATDAEYRADPTCPFTSLNSNSNSSSGGNSNSSSGGNSDSNSNKGQSQDYSDYPLVPHFASNTPSSFVSAIKAIPPIYHDNIIYVDLNLGCPQRSAYLGHFGSYLLSPPPSPDRSLVTSIVRAAANDSEIRFPISCKVRLLDSVEESVELVNDLFDAGASLVAVHGRFRATWERDGKGARDGPANMDWIGRICKECCGSERASGQRQRLLVANGNVITYDDVVKNLEETGCEGVMSAEGILDNPALFFPALEVTVKKWRKLRKKVDKTKASNNNSSNNNNNNNSSNNNNNNNNNNNKLPKYEKKLAKFDKMYKPLFGDFESLDNRMAALKISARCKISLAREYLSLVKSVAPLTLIRTVTFHVRRIMKDLLVKYQLLDDVVGAGDVGRVEEIIRKVVDYEKDPRKFVFDSEKDRMKKEWEERRKEEEGKRERYEQRMRRKAKREKLPDPDHYLLIGSDAPPRETIEALRTIDDEKTRQAIWREANHGQHCIKFHLNMGEEGGKGKGCERGKGCAFLHAEAGVFGQQNNNGSDAIVEDDEIAG